MILTTNLRSSSSSAPKQTAYKEPATYTSNNYNPNSRSYNEPSSYNTSNKYNYTNSNTRQGMSLKNTTPYQSNSPSGQYNNVANQYDNYNKSQGGGTPVNQYNNSTSPYKSNGVTPSNTDRRPIDPNDRTDIYGAQPKNQYNSQPVRNSNSYNTNGNYNNTSQQAGRNRTNVSFSNTSPQRQNTNRQMYNGNNYTTNFTQGSFENSPTQSSFHPNDYGPRIARRELWWREPERAQGRQPFSQPLRIENVTPRIDDKNPNYHPSRVQHRTIQTRRLEWHAEPLTDTWSNIRHQAGGGNVKYPQEKLRWQSTPKVDSGFIYTFE